MERTENITMVEDGVTYRRTVMYHVNEEMWQRFTRGPEEKLMQIELGFDYLRGWGISRYTHVSIYDDGVKNGDFVAVFVDPDDRQYTIGMIWREDEDRYSFHS